MERINRKNVSLFGVPVNLTGERGDDVSRLWEKWGCSDYPVTRIHESVLVELLPSNGLSKLDQGKLLRAEPGDLPLKVSFELSERAVSIKLDVEDPEYLAVLVARQAFNLLAIFAEAHIFHASGAVMPDGNAALFCGPSGAGKTTIVTRLLPDGWKKIDEEFNVLLPANREKTSRPLVVDIPAGKLFNLKRVYWLVQGKTPQRVSMSSAALAARSMAFPTFDISQAMISRALAHRAAALYQVKRYELTFPDDRAAVAKLLTEND